MKTRLLILTEIIAPYRIPVFNALARDPDIELEVVFLAETDPATRQWHIYTNEIRFSYSVLPSWRTRLGEHTILLNQNVPSVLQELAPDVILCGGYNYLASWQAQRWAQQNGVAFLLWTESTGADQRSESKVIESLKRKFFAKCDGFVVPGTSAQAYVRQIEASTKPVFIAPNAVDNQHFAENAELARADASRTRATLGLPPRYFLLVGRLLKSKGVLELVEAYGSLSDNLRSEVGLVFAGDGPLRTELESRSRLIFPGAVHFAGFVHRDELASYYALADCLVFPTHSDTWGLVVNEAMACGLPLICSEIAGCAADLVNANGLTTPPRDVQQLARAMEELAKDAGLRKEMSARSRQLITYYSPELCASGIAKAAASVFCGRQRVGMNDDVVHARSPHWNSPL